MTMAYAATVDVSDVAHGFSTVALSRSGSSTISVNVATLSTTSGGIVKTWFNHAISSGTYSVYGKPDVATSSPALTDLASSSLPVALRNALVTAATTASWPSPSNINVQFSNTTMRYTFSHSGALTAVTFGNVKTRSLFGFGGNFSGSSASVVGDDLPDFIVEPTVDGASDVSPDYEPEAISNAAYSGGGRHYGMSRFDQPIYRDWVQKFETKGQTFRMFRSGLYTLQDLFESCRSGKPFAVLNGFIDGDINAFYLREPEFAPVRASDGNDAQYHVPFKCVYAGFQ